MFGQLGITQFTLKVHAIGVGEQNRERAFLQSRILDVLFVRFVNIEQQQNEFAVAATIHAVLFQ